MDCDGWLALLRDMESGAVDLLARDLPAPSALAAEILTARPYAYLDDAPLEERRTQAVQNRRWSDPESADDLGALDLEAIEAVRGEAWPEARNADEMHEALNSLGYLTSGEAEANPGWGMACATVGATPRRTPGLRRQHSLAGGGAPAGDAPGASRGEGARRFPGASRLSAAGLGGSGDRGADPRPPGWLRAHGRAVGGRPGHRPGRPAVRVGRPGARRLCAAWPLQSRRDGRGVVRTPSAGAHPSLYGEAPAPGNRAGGARRFHAFPVRLAAPGAGTRGRGAESLATVVEQLEGFQAAAAAWESELLAARVADYASHWLDQLCRSGRIVWARLAGRSKAPAVRCAARRSCSCRAASWGSERPAARRAGAGTVAARPGYWSCASRVHRSSTN